MRRTPVATESVITIAANTVISVPSVLFINYGFIISRKFLRKKYINL